MTQRSPGGICGRVGAPYKKVLLGQLPAGNMSAGIAGGRSKTGPSRHITTVARM